MRNEVIRIASALLLAFATCVAVSDTTGPGPIEPTSKYVFQILERVSVHLRSGGEIQSIELPSDFVKPSGSVDECLEMVMQATDDINIQFAALRFCSRRHPMR
jgi:hypothetical protein